MLTFEQCAALKAAGYPQGEAAEIVWPNGYTDFRICADYDAHRGQSALAAPNSDELMAAIQARWPMADSYTLCGLSFVSPTTPNADGKYPLQTQWSASWWIQDVAHHNGRGNSPAAALCALYIALAEGGQ